MSRGNVAVEYRWAGDGNVLRDHAAQLLAMAPDLILSPRLAGIFSHHRLCGSNAMFELKDRETRGG